MKELNEISPLVGQIIPSNPFDIPANYFESFAGQMLAIVLEDGEKSILNDARQTSYGIPAGYFEKLPDMILQRAKALDLAAPDEEMGTLSPLLNSISKRGPYAVPENYFEESLEQATDGAKAIDFVHEELEILSPLMSSLKNKSSYIAPEGYFDSLPGALLNRAGVQGKVVSMHFRKKVLRYATAAVIAGLIVTSGWFYLGRQPNPNVAGIEKVTDEDLQKYVEGETFIDEAPTVSAVADIDDSDMKDMLADVSDEELQQYVEQNTGSMQSKTN